MDFSLALALLKQGHSVSRDGWNGKGLSLHLQRPDANSKMTLPYIYLEYPAGSARVPWLASQTDMLSDDWTVIAPQAAAKATQTAQEAPKRRGRPKGAARAKTPVQRDPDAPYGRKKDGTPKAPPGRKKAEPSAPAAPAA